MSNIITYLSIFFLSACALPKSNYPKVDAGELKEEIKIQQEYVANDMIRKRENKMRRKIENQKKLLEVSSRILEAGSALCNDLTDGEYGCFYEFELSQSKRLNAYADGKKIYITTAMINFLKDDSELALVLGHEYAHNLMGHIKSKKVNAAVGYFLGTVADAFAATQGFAGNAMGKLGADLGGLSYSKDFEKEADYIGLYIASLAGYDVSEAPKLWRRMSLKDDEAIYVGKTHPTNPERYIALGKTISEIKRKKRQGVMLVPDLRGK